MSVNLTSYDLFAICGAIAEAITGTIGGALAIFARGIPRALSFYPSPIFEAELVPAELLCRPKVAVLAEFEPA